MQNRAILLESKRLESYLINFQIEGALLEVMKNDLIARSIISEHRKIEKYALQLGLIDKRQLNEGLFADVALGLGQAVGGLPYLAQMGVGAAFGVAGVLWYGKEMLGNAVGSFDFFMNLVFALLSAAAIEPTGIFAEAGAFGKLIAPFAYLGQKVRALGGMAKAAAGLGPAEKAAASAASGAAGPLSKGLTFLSETVLPKVSVILESVKTSVMKLPGGKTFTQISELITKHAGKAIEALKNALSPFLRHVETATVNAQITGKEMLGKAGASAFATLDSLVAKMSPQTAQKILKTFGRTQHVLPGVGTVSLDSFKVGKGFQIKLTTEAGGKWRLLTNAKDLASLITQIAKTSGKDAAAAAIIQARSVYPQAMIKAAMQAASAVTAAPAMQTAV
jgi:hypothetical protein